MSYTSEKFNLAMSALRKIHDQDLESMNTSWAKNREKSDKQLPKMLKEAKKEATASLKIENTKLKEEIKILKEERKDIPMTELEQLKAENEHLKLKEEGFDNVLKVRSSLAKGEIHHRDEEIKKLKE